MKQSEIWLDKVYSPFFNSQEECTIFTGVESIYFDYMLNNMFMYEKRVLKEKSTLFIDLRNNVGYSNKTKKKFGGKFKNLIISPSITFSIGLLSVELSNKNKGTGSNTFYINLGEKYFEEHRLEFEDHGNIVIFSSENSDIAIGLANKIISSNKKCIIISSLKTNKIKIKAQCFDFHVENGNDLNNELLIVLRAVIDSKELYLTHILAKNNVVRRLTLLNQLQYVNAIEYAKINDSYMSNDLHSLMFSEKYIQYYTEDEEKSDLSKYAIDIAGAIKLVREFDPFNFEMLKNLYQFMNVDLRKEYREIEQTFIFDLIFASREQTQFESDEGKIVEKIRKFQKMNSANAPYTMISLEIRELYETFLWCFRERLSFGVIQLGFLLQAQATNYGMLDIVKDVVAKKKFILSKVEGRKTNELLLHIEKLEKMLAPTIYSPNDILYVFPNLGDDIHCINFEKRIENYMYSNLLGYYAVVDSEQLTIESKKIMKNIYNHFICGYEKLGNQAPVFHSDKILNNLMIYEQKHKKRARVFSKILLDKVISEPKSYHIILLYNVIGVLLNNKYKSEDYNKIMFVYRGKYIKKSSDDFYVFYNQCLNLYINNINDDFPYSGVNLEMIPEIYKGRFLEEEIIRQAKQKKTSNENNYLFIDNQFWFNE